MALWWLSFSDEDELFGVMLVEATTLETAKQKAERLGSPGCSVLAEAMGVQEKHLLHDVPRNTLLSEADLKDEGVTVERVLWSPTAPVH